MIYRPDETDRHCSQVTIRLGEARAAASSVLGGGKKLQSNRNSAIATKYSAWRSSLRVTSRCLDWRAAVWERDTEYAGQTPFIVDTVTTERTSRERRVASWRQMRVSTPATARRVISGWSTRCEPYKHTRTHGRRSLMFRKPATNARASEIELRQARAHPPPGHHRAKAAVSNDKYINRCLIWIGRRRRGSAPPERVRWAHNAKHATSYRSSCHDG